MLRLSSPVSQIKDHYTVVVAGSGYGGGIAASRLARAGQQVCVLERGREFLPGEYPDTEAEALAEMQAEFPTGHMGSRTALYDFYINSDVNVFVGCGLGGTSLINASVAVKPEQRVFEDARWPAALRSQLVDLDEGYRRAQEMLRPVPYPPRYPALPKLEALEKSAAALRQSCSRAPIAVNFSEGQNHVGVSQRACMLCGDCITGCNYGAKNTVLFNYLPDARNFGAEIYTQVCVRHLERKDGRWLVHYQVLATGMEDGGEPLRTVSADIVVLAAGTLGSTEILLRSKAAGLPLSDHVGLHFSGNGDAIGYSYDCTDEIRGVGYGCRDARDMQPVGPCVTSAIDMRGQPELNDGVVIHEIVTPGALAGLLPEALARTGAALGKVSGEALGEALATDEAEIESIFLGPYDAAADHTQAYLVTTHERGSGTIKLDGGRLRIDWPHVGEQPIFRKVNNTLAEATRALGGNYLINPVWSTVFNRDLITFHPLGGCRMSEDAAQGVVNHKGQVFAGAAGTAVHEGLYVCDGSTIPRSLGVAPLLTISALSERACALLAQDRGWHIDYALPSRPAPAVTAMPLGIQFTETVRGEDLELDLMVIADDLDMLIGVPAGKTRVAGKAVAMSLSPGPLQAFGEFSLGRMAYSLTLAGSAGQTYYLEGWRGASALAVTVHSGPDSHSPVVLKDTLRVLPKDLGRQLSTLRVLNAATPRERLEATARLGHALAGDLYEIYGSVTGARKKRPLRVNAPTVYSSPKGGPHPWLVRYEGGSRGPVLLAPDPGESSLIFTLDTLETNLLEFLFAHSYDVWLLHSADAGGCDAAVARIREIAGVTGAQVQVLAGDWRSENPVELNAATRDAIPEEWHHLAILGQDAAQDVYPRILAGLQRR